MDRKALSELLQEALEALSAGYSMDEVLGRHPEFAEELRPLLKAALLSGFNQKKVDVPQQTLIRSRVRFLSEARRLQPRSPWYHFLILRPAGLAAMFSIIFLFSLVFGSNFVSAQAVPGDTLYSIKRAVENVRLSLVSDPASRLSLEENFDQRRVSEAVTLLSQGRVEQVTFAGMLSIDMDGTWLIAGVPVGLNEKDIRLAERLNGSYVETSGVTGKGQVQVSRLQLRLFHLNGSIQISGPDLWRVGGVQVAISPATSMNDIPAVGKEVQITAIRMEKDRLLALQVHFPNVDTSSNQTGITPNVTLVTVLPSSTVSPTPTSTVTPRPSETKPALPTVSVPIQNPGSADEQTLNDDSSSDSNDDESETHNEDDHSESDSEEKSKDD